MMKKLISMAFVLIMICCMTGTAMAESETENQITVTVKLNQTLTGEFRNVQGQLNYDPDVLTYVSHSMGTDYADYASKDMPAKKYFTFSRTDMSQTGFTMIPKGTIAVVTFEHDGSLTDVQLDTAFTLKLTVQDTAGNIEQVSSKGELVVKKQCAHSWKAATCTKPKTCSLCQATEGSKLGHKYSSSYTVDKKATTSADGSKSKHCTRSGCTAKSSVTAIPKIASVTLSTTKYTYTGYSKTPTVTVKDAKGNILKKDTDYTVTYPSSRWDVGRYKVTIKMKGSYLSTFYRYYTIVPKAPSCASAYLTSYYGQYTGYDDVRFTWSKARGASGYYVYYKKSTSDSYTYLTKTSSTSVRKKDLTDGVKYIFKVVPYYKSGDTNYTSLSYTTASVYTLKKLAAPTVTKSGTKVKVSWKNISGETGYQISRSTSKTGTNVVSTYATTSGTYKTVSADRGKTYYYKVRAYKTLDGTKIYGPWSDVKVYKRT